RVGRGCYAAASRFAAHPRAARGPAAGAPRPVKPTKADLFVSDVQTTDSAPDPDASTATATAEGQETPEGYTPREIVADDLGGSFADAIDATLVSVEDGDIVKGTVV